MSWLKVLVVATLLLTGCQREEPREVVKVSGRIFVFNYRVATATYLVTLQRTAPIQEGSTIEAEFENPRGGQALSVKELIFSKSPKVTLQSPPVQCVKEGHPYQVTIRLRAQDGHVIQTIEITVTSDTDQSLLPAKPLVVGPLYTPNPEVFMADGKTNMKPAQECPS